MKNLKIIFMGTPLFAHDILQHLIENQFNIIAVVTQPDKQVGRKRVITPPLVKTLALEHGIEVLQPINIKTDYQEIVDLNPDLIITAAYGQIVPQAVLDAPKIDCINCHGSLLPKYRGGAPIHYAILNGDEYAGVTIMKMVAKMDAGDMISQSKFEILPTDTLNEVYSNMTQVAKELLVTTLDDIKNNNHSYTPQDEALVTYSPNISRAQELIDFNGRAVDVYNKVRAFNPWPLSYFIHNQKTFKLLKVKITDIKAMQVGHVIVNKGEILIGCSDFYVSLIEFKPEGKKAMLVTNYLNGASEFIDNTFVEVSNEDNSCKS